MEKAVPSVAFRLLTLSLGAFFWVVFLLISVFNFSFFQRRTEKQELELRLAQDRFWNLSKTWSGLNHKFYKLRSGLKLHYVTSDGLSNNGTNGVSNNKQYLLIFIHGFPDSWVLWRHLLPSVSLQAQAALVAVDLPGYGGSDSFPSYGAYDVLEALTEFIVGMRDEHVGKKVCIVGHDWGSILGFRLAAEAGSLADRFVLSNGPHPSLFEANRDRILSSSHKLWDTFLHSPISSRNLALKSLKTLGPLLAQAMMVGHAWAFQLPLFLVDYLGTGGNYSFLRGAHKYAAGEVGNYNFADSMACSLGPSATEFSTKTSDGEQYSPSVLKRAKFGGFIDKTRYYREGAWSDEWHKSIETIMELSQAEEKPLRRSSSGAGYLEEQYTGALKAPATVVWAEDDVALSKQVMLQGLPDYLAKESQIVVLPKCGHWPQIELKARAAFEEVLNWVVDGESGDVLTKVKGVYPGANEFARK